MGPPISKSHHVYDARGLWVCSTASGIARFRRGWLCWLGAGRAYLFPLLEVRSQNSIPNFLTGKGDVMFAHCQRWAKTRSFPLHENRIIATVGKHMWWWHGFRSENTWCWHGFSLVYWNDCHTCGCSFFSRRLPTPPRVPDLNQLPGAPHSLTPALPRS